MRTAIHATRCLLLSLLLFQQALAEDKSSTADDPDTKVVTGQVLDESDRPVEGALVWVLRNPDEDRLEATTAADGRFKLRLPSDFSAYFLTCIATADDGSKQGLYRPKPAERTLPESITISLKPARQSQVSVADENGKPIPDADVQVFAEYNPFLHVRTGAAGKVVLKTPADLRLDAVVALKPGAGLDYFLFQRPAPNPKQPGLIPQDSNAPLQFKLTGARQVSVRVRDTHGKPIEGVRVNPWYFQLPGKGGMLNVSGLSGQFCNTNADGIATFDFIPSKNEGEITFWSRKPETHKKQRSSFDPASFVDRIEVTMPQLMPVRGRAVDLDGKPVADAEVAAVGNNYDFVNGRFGADAKSDVDGNFELMLAPNHFYSVVARKEREISPGVVFVLKEDPPDCLVLKLQPATRLYGTVTVGPDNSPVKDQRIELALKPSSNYLDLPPEQRLPNPSGLRRTLVPYHSRSTQTDTKGRFEFLVGPGDYYLSGPKQADRQNISVDGREEMEVNFHAERPENIRLIGRAFFKDRPDKPLAGATVYVHPAGPGGSRLSRITVKTDERGIFQCERPYSRCIAYVATEDRSYAAIAHIELEQKRLELAVVPTSRATGRLVSQRSGEALPGEEIRYGVRVSLGDGKRVLLWTMLFGGITHTADDGSFELTGLLPGFEYTMELAIERINGGRAFSWRDIDTVKLDAPGPIDLGDVYLAPGFIPPTFNQLVDNWFANNTEPAIRIASKLRDARLAHQNLIAIIAAQKHPFVQQFFQTKYDLDHTRNAQRKRLYEATANFELLAFQPIRLKRAANLPDGFAKLTKSLPEDDAFTLAVFSPTGDLLATTQQALTTDGRLDLEKMYAFLADHAPEIPDAKEFVDAAFTRAKRENKKVLLQHSGAFCGPCVLLSRYLDKHRALIEKDYVWVKIDKRYEHGPEMVEQYRFQPGGIPWFVIMDADRKPLVTSNAEKGNIGYPASVPGRKHFESMGSSSSFVARNGRGFRK